MADDGGSSGRLRRDMDVVRPATCGWPWPRCAATTCGDAPGAASSSTGSRARRARRPRRGQPADHRRCGSRPATSSPAWTGSARCSVPTAACCRCPPCRCRSWPTSPACTRTTRAGSAGARARSQVATTPGEVVRPARRAARSAGLPGGGRGDRGQAEAIVIGPGLLVHLRAGPPAGAGHRRRRRRVPAPRGRRAQPRGAAGGDQRVLSPRATSRSWPRSSRRCRFDIVLADPAQSPTIDALAAASARRRRELVLAPVASRRRVGPARRRPAGEGLRRDPRHRRAGPAPCRWRRRRWPGRSGCEGC